MTEVPVLLQQGFDLLAIAGSGGFGTTDFGYQQTEGIANFLTYIV